jgi:hypothetical protein
MHYTMFRINPAEPKKGRNKVSCASNSLKLLLSGLIHPRTWNTGWVATAVSVAKDFIEAMLVLPAIERNWKAYEEFQSQIRAKSLP